VLIDLESGRVFERILNPAEGLYPKIGNITTGSGFSFGPGYRYPRWFDGQLEFSSFVAASFSHYWMIDARLQAPRLAGGRVGWVSMGSATISRRRISSVSALPRRATTR
jgi:hypothetical protein